MLRFINVMPILVGMALLLPVSVQAAGDAEAGKAKSSTCMGCHGIPKYSNVYPSYKVPKLGGQSAEYIAAALKAYKDGSRQHPTMTAQGESLSDQDIEDIAAFLSTAPRGDK